MRRAYRLCCVKQKQSLTVDLSLELPQALTPNHLLLLKTKPSWSPGVFKREDQYARRRWKQVQYLADIFWKRWCKEYLTQLQERQRWSIIGRNLHVGDVVLIVDETSSRGSWPLEKGGKNFPRQKRSCLSSQGPD